ncbi:MAG: hypothetical protein PF436_05630 [Prolixibacteraceae bacterium]|jgi:hypothetical protein|nr:hypothetical protein [Prolixibacteraceae bacterium]
MKKSVIYYFILMSMSSCISFGGDDSSDKLVFVGSYFTDGSLPDYTAKVTVDVKDGSVDVSKLTDMITQRYNYYSFWHNGFARNGRVAYYAHESNFEDEESSQRWDSFIEPVFLDVSSGEVTRCPVPTSPFETNLIPWVRSLKPIYIDNKGRIFYTVWYGLEYGDLHRPTIFRYDPETEEYTYTRGADVFVASQPEKGNDTENGAFSEGFAISSDGRYAYCIIYGYGTDFGSYHTDYSFLVEYDFETHEITRLDGGVRGGSIYGINSDYSKLVYSMSGKKYIDLATRQINDIEEIYFSSYPHCSFSTTAAVDAKTTGLYYVDFTKSTEERITDRGAYSAQFDKNGNIYFLKEGEGVNYICKKVDYTADTGYDTIASMPSNVRHVLLVE